MLSQKLTTSSLKQTKSSLQSGASSLMPDSPRKDRFLSVGLGKSSSSGRSLSTPGNNRRRALRIKESPFFISEKVGTSEGTDFYRIQTTKKSDVRFFLYNNSGFLGSGSKVKAQLQDRRGRVLASKTTKPTSEGDFAEISPRLRAGTYYLQVKSKGSSADYDLAFSNEFLK